MAWRLSAALWGTVPKKKEKTALTELTVPLGEGKPIAGDGVWWRERWRRVLARWAKRTAYGCSGERRDLHCARVRRRRAAGGCGPSEPARSPDGSTLCFLDLRGRARRAVIMAVSVAGGVARADTRPGSPRGGHRGRARSNDGRRWLFKTSQWH